MEKNGENKVDYRFLRININIFQNANKKLKKKGWKKNSTKAQTKLLDCLWFENFKTWLAFKDVVDINDFVSKYPHNKVTFQEKHGVLRCPSIKFTFFFLIMVYYKM